MERKLRAYSLIKTLFVLIALATAACHREVAVPPLPLRNITLTDKFFDVWPTSPTRAFVVGDRGKVLLTEDGGRTFKRIDIGTQLGVFGIQMTDDQNGYLCGQDGLVMRTRDGGKTWKRLNSRTHLFIFGLSFPDTNHGFFVGDRALVMSTTNGGESFHQAPACERIFPPELADYALPYEEPVLYSASFVDVDHGWVVGELGRIWATENGGKSWNEQQQSLVPQWKRAPGINDDPHFLDFLLPTLFQRLVPRSKAWRGMRTRGLGDSDRRRRQDLDALRIRRTSRARRLTRWCRERRRFPRAIRCSRSICSAATRESPPD